MFRLKHETTYQVPVEFQANFSQKSLKQKYKNWGGQDIPSILGQGQLCLHAFAFDKGVPRAHRGSLTIGNFLELITVPPLAQENNQEERERKQNNIRLLISPAENERSVISRKLRKKIFAEKGPEAIGAMLSGLESEQDYINFYLFMIRDRPRYRLLSDNHKQKILEGKIDPNWNLTDDQSRNLQKALIEILITDDKTIRNFVGKTYRHEFDFNADAIINIIYFAAIKDENNENIVNVLQFFMRDKQRRTAFINSGLLEAALKNENLDAAGQDKRVQVLQKLQQVLFPPIDAVIKKLYTDSHWMEIYTKQKFTPVLLAQLGKKLDEKLQSFRADKPSFNKFNKWLINKWANSKVQVAIEKAANQSETKTDSVLSFLRRFIWQRNITITKDISNAVGKIISETIYLFDAVIPRTIDRINLKKKLDLLRNPEGPEQQPQAVSQPIPRSQPAVPSQPAQNSNAEPILPVSPPPQQPAPSSNAASTQPISPPPVPTQQTVQNSNPEPILPVSPPPVPTQQPIQNSNAAATLPASPKSTQQAVQSSNAAELSHDLPPPLSPELFASFGELPVPTNLPPPPTQQQNQNLGETSQQLASPLPLPSLNVLQSWSVQSQLPADLPPPPEQDVNPQPSQQQTTKNSETSILSSRTESSSSKNLASPRNNDYTDLFHNFNDISFPPNGDDQDKLNLTGELWNTIITNSPPSTPTQNSERGSNSLTLFNITPVSNKTNTSLQSMPVTPTSGNGEGSLPTLNVTQKTDTSLTELPVSPNSHGSPLPILDVTAEQTKNNSPSLELLQVSTDSTNPNPDSSLKLVEITSEQYNVSVQSSTPASAEKKAETTPTLDPMLFTPIKSNSDSSGRRSPNSYLTIMEFSPILQTPTSPSFVDNKELDEASKQLFQESKEDSPTKTSNQNESKDNLPTSPQEQRSIETSVQLLPVTPTKEDESQTNHSVMPPP